MSPKFAPPGIVIMVPSGSVIGPVVPPPGFEFGAGLYSAESLAASVAGSTYPSSLGHFLPVNLTGSSGELGGLTLKIKLPGPLLLPKIPRTK